MDTTETKNKIDNLLEQLPKFKVGDEVICKIGPKPKNIAEVQECGLKFMTVKFWHHVKPMTVGIDSYRIATPEEVVDCFMVD